MQTDLDNIKPLIGSREIGDWLSRSDVILADARGGPDAKQNYLEGHLPGAIFVDVETQLSPAEKNPIQGGRHPLPTPQRFAEVLNQLGLRPGTTVLIYDDQAGSNAACRFWWMLKSFGHLSAAVIDGGLQGAVEAGLTIQKGWIEPQSNAANTSHPVRSWTLGTVNMDEVAGGLAHKSSLVIDVRQAERYRGEIEPIDLIAGHIPGAINVPYAENLGKDGKFLPSEVLREKYQKLLDENPDRELIVHCGSGVSACHTLLALEIAGLPPAKLYVGSWSEWSRNDRPIAQG